MELLILFGGCYALFTAAEGIAISFDYYTNQK